MATYEEWNSALRTYLVGGLPLGNPIYLSVDDTAIIAAGRDLTSVTLPNEGGAGNQPLPLLPDQPIAEAPRSDLVQDFQRAVRSRVGRWGDVIDLGPIRGMDSQGNPKALPFLCAMVLAASRMADEGDVSEINYFTRLHEVLGLVRESGRTRPRGMDFGYEAEEPLWKAWNLWLQERGFVPTARRGEGPKTYISYPLSQALLRRADKDKLRRLFQASNWTADWDAETVFGRVLNASGHLTQHLQEVLASGGQRLQALTESLFDEYEVWREAPQLRGAGAGYRAGGVLMAGLYRTADPISGKTEYYAYARQRRGQDVDGRQVALYGETHTFAPERAGWLAPFGPIGEVEIELGLKLLITPAGETHTLILPSRAFWILVPDPADEDSGVYATWGAAPLGTAFVVLCERRLLPDLQRLKDERLIQWNGEPVSPWNEDHWVEIRHCMVTSEAWEGVFPENADLYEALRPLQKLSIAPSGGLRVPGLSGWLDGFGPQVTVFGFQAEVDVKVVRASATSETTIFEETHPTGASVTINWPGPGVYRIEAAGGSDEQTRVIRILPWDDLTSASIARHESVQIGNVRICGAQITDLEEVA